MMRSRARHQKYEVSPSGRVEEKEWVGPKVSKKRQYKPSSPAAWIMLSTALSIVFFREIVTTRRLLNTTQTADRLSFFASGTGGTGNKRATSYFDPKYFQPIDDYYEEDPDYNGLEFETVTNFHRGRRIPKTTDDLEDEQKSALLDDLDEEKPRMIEHYDDEDPESECQSTKWSHEMFQTCNNLHALDYFRLDDDNEYTVKQLGNGHYRQSFLFTPKDSDFTPFVAKNQVFDRIYKKSDYKKVFREARFLEDLTSSKITSNIYGHCAGTVLVEQAKELSDRLVPHRGATQKRRIGRISQDELDKLEEDGPHPMNDFTPAEKLDILIAMAQGLAELHGHRNGVWAHDDITIHQWMESMDGRIILNDFNEAVPLKWSGKRYCRYRSHYPGSFKAPEVHADDQNMVKESADIWPFGNLIFVMLTGLLPYYGEESRTDAHELAKEAEVPYIKDVENRHTKDQLVLQRRELSLLENVVDDQARSNETQ